MDIYKSCENRNPASKKERSQGFSLVEVVITLGLVTFCLVAILGMLPQSLNVVQDANREAEASRLLKQLATGIQAAYRDGDGRFHMLDADPNTDISWVAGEAKFVHTGYLSVSGENRPGATDADFTWRLELVPPPNNWSSGQAVLRIAWPSTAQWGSGQWMSASGAVRSLVLFRPQ